MLICSSCFVFGFLLFCFFAFLVFCFFLDVLVVLLSFQRRKGEWVFEERNTRGGKPKKRKEKNRKKKKKKKRKKKKKKEKGKVDRPSSILLFPSLRRRGKKRRTLFLSKSIHT